MAEKPIEQARFEAHFGNMSTDDLSEGASNLYFTGAPARPVEIIFGVVALTIADDQKHLVVFGNSPDCNITLPPSTDCVEGKTRFDVWLRGLTTITVEPDGADIGIVYMTSTASGSLISAGAPLIGSGARGEHLSIFFLGGDLWGIDASGGWTV